MRGRLARVRRHRAAQEAVDGALAQDHIAVVGHLHACRTPVSEHRAGPNLTQAGYRPAACAQLPRRWVHGLSLG